MSCQREKLPPEEKPVKRAVFVCISFPSLGIGKRNQGIAQFLNWAMQATYAACGHDSNLPSAQKSRYPNGYLLFWSCWADSNCRPHPYQGCALPTELQQQSTCPLLGACVATEKGLEPSTSGVTGRRSNRLNHSATAQLIYQKIRVLSISFFKKGEIFSALPLFSAREPMRDAALRAPRRP